MNVRSERAFVLQDNDNIWWDDCIRGFFDDNATLTVSFRQDDGLRRYSKYYCETDYNYINNYDYDFL